MIFQSSCIKITGLREKITLKTVCLPLEFQGENPATSSYSMPINHLEFQGENPAISSYSMPINHLDKQEM